MQKAFGLMNPKNAKVSASSFKEGIVRIDNSIYRVYQAPAAEGRTQRPPVTAWVWEVTRLNEEGTTPLVNEDDEPITEHIVFSFGTKCLPFVQPAMADSPEDANPEPQGTNVGAEGPTILITAPGWAPHELSGVMQLSKSLAEHKVKEEYLNRCWAPDWNGCVFRMKTLVSDNKIADDKGVERAVTYKVVSEIKVGPGKGKKGGKGAAPAADAEATLKPILVTLIEALDGQQLSRKAFTNRVRAALDDAKVDTKLLVPCLSLVKDGNWLEKHARQLGITVTSDFVAFGQIETEVETEEAEVSY